MEIEKSPPHKAVEHTPLPWGIGANHTVWTDDYNTPIASIYQHVIYRDADGLAHANTEFIVRACNSHYELLEALKAARFALTLSYDGSKKPICEGYFELDEAYHKLTQAISKAEGK